MARTSASPDSPASTTRAAVRAAIARTRGSSALRTARPSGRSASTSSPLARAIAVERAELADVRHADVDHDGVRRRDPAQVPQVPGAA